MCLTIVTYVPMWFNCRKIMLVTFFLIRSCNFYCVYDLRTASSERLTTNSVSLKKLLSNCVYAQACRLKLAAFRFSKKYFAY